MSKLFLQFLYGSLIGFAIWVPISAQKTPGAQSPIDCQKAVTLIGAVRAVTPFYFEQSICLNGLINKAGGPTADAGNAVQVIYGKASRSNHSGINSASPFQLFMLSRVLEGDGQSNPELQPGDIVVIPERPRIYILGSVVSPQGVELKQDMTISQAITWAGGLTRSGRKDRIRVHRRIPGSFERVQINIDLKAIEKHRATDLVLQPFDIIEAWEKHRWDDREGPIGGDPCYPCCDRPMRVIM